jgi:hypothetical protein
VLALNGPAFTAGGGQTIKREAVDAFSLNEERRFRPGHVIGGDIVNRRIVFGE